MIATHLGLRQQPFPATPDGGCYYPATTHERALAHLEAGLADGEGILSVTGTAGTGKTLLGHLLLERLGGDRAAVFLTHAHGAGRGGLLQAILFDLGLPYEGRGEQELRLALTAHLLQSFASGHPALILVDEAHHLTPEQLEELRLLGNLETRAGKVAPIVLLGQPTLVETLARPELASLRQRMAIRTMLEPLALHEAADYLLHHLRVAGARPEGVFTEEALELLARASRGVPRLLNQTGRHALALAAESGAFPVDVEVALDALQLLGLEAPQGANALEAGVVLVATDDPSCRLFVAPRQQA